MSTKTFFWNVCGINETDKHLPFAQWLNVHRPVFGSILETHIKEPNLVSTIAKLCNGWNFASNHTSDDDGRIILLWKYPATVRILSQTSQLMTCEVFIPSSQKFVYKAVYASNLSEERTELWIDLINLQQNMALDSLSWAVGGYFNQILHPSEHSSPTVNTFSSDMVEFSDCLLQMGLFDLRYQGMFNTWMNKQPDLPIAKKLDRLLVNQAWINSFPSSSTLFLPHDFSDHTLCVLDLAMPLPISGTKPFKFFNYLTKHPKFLVAVEEAWVAAGSIATSLAELRWKLKSIKGVLKSINSINFSKIQESIIIANRLLLDV